MPQRIQRKRTKDPRRGTARPCYYGCGRTAVAGQNGYCGPECRFWSKVVKTEFCWLWTGAAHKKADGYGRVDANGKRFLAHRFAYELLVGPIPEGHELDHVVCENTRCVNPAHVEPVTPEIHGHRSGVASGRARKVAAHA